MSKRIIDTAAELLLQPYAEGFKLVRPDSRIKNHVSLYSISELFSSPLNLYFLCQHSIIQNINETTALTCGYPSIKGSIGKSRDMVADRKTVDRLNREDQEVIQSNKLRVFEENFTRLDTLTLPAIAFKFPWYNDKNKIIGILGCSIILNQTTYSIANSIETMIKLNLLAAPGSINPFHWTLPGREIDNIYLSKQELRCLSLVIKGKTAKMIAKILSLSPRTVEHYIENIKIKLKVQTKSELIDKVVSSLC